MNFQELVDSSNIDRFTYPDETFEAGFKQGEEEARFMIDNKINENGYTYDAYCQIRDRYVTAITAFNPTEWQKGYGLGMDKIAEEAKIKDPERWANDDD